MISIMLHANDPSSRILMKSIPQMLIFSAYVIEATQLTL